MFSFRQAFFKRTQQTRRPVKVEIDFRNEHKVDILLSQNGCCGNEPGMPAHEFDQPDTVGIPFGFIVGGDNCPGGHVNCRVKPK